MSSTFTQPAMEANISQGEEDAPRAPSFFARIKIGYRIYAGFAIVLMLLAGLTIYGTVQLYDFEKGLVFYGDKAGDALLLSDFQRAVIDTQLAAREYLATMTSESAATKKEAYDDNFNMILNLMAHAREEIVKPERVRLLEEIDGRMNAYKSGFMTISDLRTRAQQMEREVLAPTGEQIRENLAYIRNHAYSRQEFEMAEHASEGLEELLLARLNVMKFRADSDQSSADLVIENLDKLDLSLVELDEHLLEANPRLKQAEAAKLATQYRAVFEEMYKAILDSNKMRAETLDKGAHAIMAAADAITVSAKTEEEDTQERLTEQLDKFRQMLAYIGSLAIFAGLVSAFLIARSITKPVLTLTAIMSKLAENDLGVDVVGRRRKDELGEMARAVEVFKKNGIRAREMEEEQEEQKRRAEEEKHALMIQMADDLTAMWGQLSMLSQPLRPS